MLRSATSADRPALEAFLEAHPDTSMFLRSNLAAHGLQSDHPYGTEFFLWHQGDDLRAVFGCNNAGNLMCQMPDPDPAAAAAFAQAVSGRKLIGITGEAAQVPMVVEALGFAPEQWAMQADDPLYALDLSDLRPPAPFGTLRPAAEPDRALLQRWFAEYEVDSGLFTGADAAERRANGAAQNAIQGDDVRILEDDSGTPVAMTGFNARLPDIVQVGGVFVCRSQRKRGLARRVVAAHLEEVATAGVTRALLFAASDTAARAYEAIGFARVGTYRINLLAEGACP